MSSVAPLVVTAGEPAGIGPELCLTVAAQPDCPDLVIVGDANLLRTRAEQLALDVSITATSIDQIDGCDRSGHEIYVVDQPFPAAVECGKPNPDNAAVLLDGLRIAVNGCLRGHFSALVTAPVAKHVINDAGIAFTGHTEFLAELTAADLPVMLLVAGDMRVALASTHMPLRAVPDYLDQNKIHQVLDVLIGGLRRQFGIDDPEVLVCGLNPHAGEGGHLGHEDNAIIAPAVATLQQQGAKVRGPIPADTAFTPMAGSCDAVLAMYHDQGLPVLKYAGFGDAVNVTLGLPIIRTSVDHGTAFDLAGTGAANAGSMQAAINLAANLAQSD